MIWCLSHYVKQEDKKLTHGYVCAKNVLLKHNGLKEQAGPFIKLSDPGVAISVLNKAGNTPVLYIICMFNLSCI